MSKRAAAKIVKGKPAGRATAARRAETVAEQRRRVDRVKAAQERGRRQQLAAAQAQWSQLTTPQQLELAAQVVEARREELRAAYPGVVAVASGFGTRRATAAEHKKQSATMKSIVADASKSGRQKKQADAAVPLSRLRRVRQPAPRSEAREIKPVPCVTFLVRRKIKVREGRPPGHVPEFLLTHWGQEGRLCAVPTDIEEVRHLRGTPHHRQIMVEHPQYPAEVGAVTCLVRRPGDPQSLFALSCRHVFGLSASNPPQFPVGAAISVARLIGTTFQSQPPIFAKAVGVYGLLVDGERVSFDVALAGIDAAQAASDAARNAITAINPPQSANSLAQIQALQNYKIVTPDGTLNAKFVRAWSVQEQPAIRYSNQLTEVYQAVPVIESLVQDGIPISGHSGSPVISADGSTLLGMHFAGRFARSYMIPAYDLLSTDNFIGMAAGAQLTLA